MQTNKKSWTKGKTRSVLYKIAKILGDVNSVKRGTMGRRITSRVAGKVSGRVTGAITRSFMKLFK